MRTTLPVLLFFSLLSCQSEKPAQPTKSSYVTVVKPIPAPIWNKVVVMDFDGVDEESHLAKDSFVGKMKDQKGIEVLEPKHPTPKNISLEQARKLAKKLHAEAFFRGEVESMGEGKNMNAFATIDLIDTKTGRMVASTRRESYEVLATEKSDHIESAIEQAAKDMLHVVKSFQKQP